VGVAEMFQFFLLLFVFFLFIGVKQNKVKRMCEKLLIFLIELLFMLLPFGRL